MQCSGGFYLFCIFFALSILTINASESSEEEPTEEVDAGGWDAFETGEASSIPNAEACDIDIQSSSLTQQEFLERYAYKEPVIFRGVTDNTVFREMSTKENLLKDYGDKIVRISTANTYSYSKVDVTLRKYVEEILGPQKLDAMGNETLYWFGDNNVTEWKKLFDAYVPPPYKIPPLYGAYSYGLAGAGTGVPFHFHGPGFAEVIFGKKRWFMYPPHQEPKFNPDRSTFYWYMEDYPKLPSYELPLQCTVGPGDIIFFPDHWWHATLNMETSVFISTFLG